jgi:hypothetical protein
MKKTLCQRYKAAYEFFYKKCSDATRAKLLTIKENIDSPLVQDADVKQFAKDVCELAEQDSFWEQGS